MCCTYRLLLDIKARGWLVSWCQIFIGIETSVTLRLGVVESVLDMGSSQIGNALRSGYIGIECCVVLVEHCCLLDTGISVGLAPVQIRSMELRMRCLFQYDTSDVCLTLEF